MKVKILTYVMLFFVAVVSVAMAAGQYKQSDIRLSPRLLNYQGYLTDTLGNSINDSFDILFRIYDAASAGNLLWSETQMEIPILKGIFNVLLGSAAPIPDSVFTKGTNRWLELRFNSQTLAPRTQIVSAPYAYTAIYSDTAQYARISAPDNDWTRSGRKVYTYYTTDSIGIRTNTPRYALDVNGVICGGTSNAVNAAYGGVLSGYGNVASGYAATVAGGFYDTAYAMYGAVLGGYNNVAGDVSGDTAVTVCGGYNNFASGRFSFVGGGLNNGASGDCATIAGGYSNIAYDYGTVAGGYDNLANNRATVGGGFADSAKTVYSGALSGYSNLAGDAAADTAAVVVGGWDNSALAKYSYVGGGMRNSASEYATTISGGYTNTASNFYSTVGGGVTNVASGNCATVSGGTADTASGTVATVGGGQSNIASGTSATVSGGYDNTASGYLSTVAGGRSNNASDSGTFVGGGRYNSAYGRYSVVCGGGGPSALDSNSAFGGWSAIGGGRRNIVRDYYSVVAGGYANIASGSRSTVAGGYYNTADTIDATVGGGNSNLAGASSATVGGGFYNIADAYYATVSGGYYSVANGLYGAVAGGYRDSSTASYSFTVGNNSTVLSGFDNSAAFNGQSATASGQTRVGALSKVSGTFTIDHPLDPENKILNHYFVESPEMVLIYRGSVILDAGGRAVVNLPDYFSALNEVPLIQLTGVGTSDVYIAEEVRENSFVVGGKPAAKVHWTVTGARKDPSAEITKIIMPVEQPKEGGLAGRSLDDEFLVTTMAQLERMGKADGFKFRRASERMRYEEMRKLTENK